ncbi:hypothetical protein L1887_49616 [Cichorium endivia]|nr:hypothetical protein L1887_49616 [Cichorium endivia]
MPAHFAKKILTSVALLASLATATSVFAHAHLKSETPAADSTSVQHNCAPFAARMALPGNPHGNICADIVLDSWLVRAVIFGACLDLQQADNTLVLVFAKRHLGQFLHPPSSRAIHVGGSDYLYLCNDRLRVLGNQQAQLEEGENVFQACELFMTRANQYEIDNSISGLVARLGLNFPIQCTLCAALPEDAPASKSCREFKPVIMRMIRRVMTERNVALSSICWREIDGGSRSASCGGTSSAQRTRSGAAHKTIEAQRLRKEGVPVVEIAEALELSEATVRRYLKTTVPSQE